MTAVQLKALCVSLNIDLQESQGHSLDLDAWSPPGKIFRASSCHTIVVHEFDVGEKGQMAKLRQAMADQILEGLEDCTTPDCDTCGGE